MGNRTLVSIVTAGDTYYDSIEDYVFVAKIAVKLNYFRKSMYLFVPVHVLGI